MKLLKKPRITKVSIEDFYALKLALLWQGVKQEHISFWAITMYFFFEYVRPQSIYLWIDFIPWAQIALVFSVAAAFSDRTVKWVSCIENKFLILFFIIVIMSGVFAFDPAESWSNKTNIIKLVRNIVNMISPNH